MLHPNWPDLTQELFFQQYPQPDLEFGEACFEGHSGLYPKYPKKQPFEDSFAEATFEPLGELKSWSWLYTTWDEKGSGV